MMRLPRVLRFLGINPGAPHDAFEHSGAYWENRYLDGGNSGPGSYGKLAVFKAQVLNNFVDTEGIDSVIEFGCGDGHQLSLARYPKYLGIDSSPAAIDRCKALFQNDVAKKFQTLAEYDGEHADAALSLDVLYHLVEDDVFEKYMAALFAAAGRWVVVYSSNFEGIDEHHASHVRHRKFTDFVAHKYPDWRCGEVIQNEYPFNGDFRESTHSNFYFFRKLRQSLKR